MLTRFHLDDLDGCQLSILLVASLNTQIHKHRLLLLHCNHQSFDKRTLQVCCVWVVFSCVSTELYLHVCCPDQWSAKNSPHCGMKDTQTHEQENKLAHTYTRAHTHTHTSEMCSHTRPNMHKVTFQSVIPEWSHFSLLIHTNCKDKLGLPLHINISWMCQSWFSVAAISQ